MIRNRHLPRLQRFAEIFFLVLLLWPVPVPMGHSHSDIAQRVPGVQMVQHLQKHHGGLANADHWPQDWHWHWDFPRDGFGVLGGEQFVVSSEHMLVGRSFDIADFAHASPIERLMPDRYSSLSKVPESRRYSFQSVALMHSRQSLPEILGVMRL